MPYHKNDSYNNAWSLDELRKLHQLRRMGLTHYEIAIELGRTKRAVDMASSRYIEEKKEKGKRRKGF